MQQLPAFTYPQEIVARSVKKPQTEEGISNAKPNWSIYESGGASSKRRKHGRR
jgi:hypothetical protein